MKQFPKTNGAGVISINTWCKYFYIYMRKLQTKTLKNSLPAALNDLQDKNK